VYAHLILAGQNVEFWNNFRRDGAGPLRLPSDGSHWWGKVAVGAGDTIPITLDVPEGIDRVDAACWWPEAATLGPDDDPVQAPHNHISLQLVAPDNRIMESWWPTSVFQRVQLPTLGVSGPWQLRIEATGVRTDDPQTVYWAAHGSPAEPAATSAAVERSLEVADVEEVKPPFDRPRGYAGRSPQGLTPSWVTQMEGKAGCPGQAIFLQGYVGRACDPDHFRLYQDPGLRRYIDIPNDKLLHGIITPPDLAPLEPAYIWIAADAMIVVGQAHTTAAHLLDGPISREYGGGLEAWQPGSGRAPGMGGGPSLVPGCAPSSTCASHNCPI
jgi:hypothetical protein